MCWMEFEVVLSYVLRKISNLILLISLISRTSVKSITLIFVSFNFLYKKYVNSLAVYNPSNQQISSDSHNFWSNIVLIFEVLLRNICGSHILGL